MTVHRVFLDSGIQNNFESLISCLLYTALYLLCFSCLSTFLYSTENFADSNVLDEEKQNLEFNIMAKLVSIKDIDVK